MRAVLDGLYVAALWLAGLCLCIIALMVGAQVLGRVYDNLLVLAGYPRHGFIILSLGEIAGFLLAASSFLALAATLKAGAHIRVTLFLSLLPSGARRACEALALAFAAFACGWATFYLARLTIDSWRFNELSVGLLPLQLWPWQAVTVLGAALLTIAFLDELVRVLRGLTPSFRAAEDAIALGKEG